MIFFQFLFYWNILFQFLFLFYTIKRIIFREFIPDKLSKDYALDRIEVVPVMVYWLGQTISY